MTLFLRLFLTFAVFLRRLFFASLRCFRFFDSTFVSRAFCRSFFLVRLISLFTRKNFNSNVSNNIQTTQQLTLSLDSTTFGVSIVRSTNNFKMLLRYYLDAETKRVYTTDTVGPKGEPTFSAHPARFSPDDKYSAQRFQLKKRFGILK